MTEREKIGIRLLLSQPEIVAWLALSEREISAWLEPLESTEDDEQRREA